MLRTEARKLTRSALGRPVAATHVAQVTCPGPGEVGGGCPWKGGGGCYAESGPEGYVTSRLARSELSAAAAEDGAGGDTLSLAGKAAARGRGSADSRALGVSLEEARQIWAAAAGTLPGGPGEGGGTIRGVPLRLHVVGDCASGLGALVVGRAVSGGWLSRGGGAAWTYTHSWRGIRRSAWGPGVSVLASCETTQDARRAMDRGYAVALVGLEGIDDLRGSGELGAAVMECPEQLGTRADCASCMACSRMRAGAGAGAGAGVGAGVLVLRPHGPGAGHGPSRAMRARLAGFAS